MNRKSTCVNKRFNKHVNKYCDNVKHALESLEQDDVIERVPDKQPIPLWPFQKRTVEYEYVRGYASS